MRLSATKNSVCRSAVSCRTPRTSRDPDRAPPQIRRPVLDDPRNRRGDGHEREPVALFGELALVDDVEPHRAAAPPPTPPRRCASSSGASGPKPGGPGRLPTCVVQSSHRCGSPQRRYIAGTTTMLSSVDVIGPHEVTMRHRRLDLAAGLAAAQRQRNERRPRRQRRQSGSAPAAPRRHAITASRKSRARPPCSSRWLDVRRPA